MKKSLCLLLIMDTDLEAMALVQQLRGEGYEPVFIRATNEAEVYHAIQKQEWDLVIADYSLSRYSALNALRLLRENQMDIPCIVLGGEIGVSRVAEIMRAGASDYLLKEKAQRLSPVIEREIQELEIRRDQERLFELITHAKQEWEAVVDSISDIFILTDLDGKIIRLNKAAIDLFETGYLSVLGNQIEDLFFRDLDANELQMSQLKGVMQLSHLGGWFEVSSYPVYLFDEHSGMVYIIRDVTKKVEAESVLSASQKMTDLGILAAGIAEKIEPSLKEIIGLCGGAIKRLRQAPKEIDRVLSGLGKIQWNAWNIQSMMDVLYHYARPQADIPDEIDINEVVNEAYDLISEQLKKNPRVQPVFKLAQALPRVVIPRNRLLQVLVNLISNAWEAMPDGGTIEISTDFIEEKEQILIRVTDSGKGIPDEIQEHIFEPYFSTKYIGQGLGLFVVKNIMLSFGGKIELKSELDKGSQFSVYIPTQETHFTSPLQDVSPPIRFDDIVD